VRCPVPIAFKPFSHDRDVNFLPLHSQSTAYLANAGAFLESVCTDTTQSVFYHNKTSRPIIIPTRTTIGEISDFDDNTECFHLDTNGSQLQEAYHAAERHAPQFQLPSSITGLYLSSEAYMGIGDRVPKATQEQLSDAIGDSLLDDIGGDITSSIDDIKYRPDLTDKQLQQLKEIVSRHRAIWERTDGVVDEPSEDWLRIKLKPDADLRSRGVYRLGAKDREVVDEVFDKLRADGKMSRSPAGPVGWGVFVVRNRLKPGDKGRVVVDTRGLNAAAEDDTYPLPRQEDIMARIRWRHFIALLDQIKSYYQCILHPESRQYAAVVSHRGREHYNVVPMGYKGSPAHQQRYMD
jgi:hypothetical protein